MKKVLLITVLICILTGLSYASDVTPTRKAGGYFWDISGVIDTTGDSNIMIGNLYCKEYVMFIVTSGSVNLTAAVKIGYGSNYSTLNTYTISSATTTAIYWSFPTPRMYLTYTITGGQIDDTVVYCRE